AAGEAVQGLAQSVVGDAGDGVRDAGLVDRWRRRALDASLDRHRSLVDLQSPHGAIAEIAVDALEHLWLPLLPLESGRAGGPHMQGAVATPAAGEGKAERQAAAGDGGADDGSPVGDEPALGEPVPPEDLARDPRQRRGDAQHRVRPRRVRGRRRRWLLSLHAAMVAAAMPRRQPSTTSRESLPQRLLAWY